MPSAKRDRRTPWHTPYFQQRLAIKTLLDEEVKRGRQRVAGCRNHTRSITLDSTWTRDLKVWNVLYVLLEREWPRFEDKNAEVIGLVSSWAASKVKVLGESQSERPSSDNN
jgi:hypothetical protein